MKKFASQFVSKSPFRKLNKKIVGQDTGEIKTDKKGEYVMHGKDTIRPANNKNFRPFVKGKQSGKMSSGYLSDDDYTIKDGKLAPSMKQDSIKPIPKSIKEAAKLGGAGAIGIIGGAAGAGAKAGARAAKALGNDARAGITITKPNPQGIKGTSKSRTGKGKIHDLIPGSRSMKGMKSYKGGR
jgi:hypothetical protein